MVVSTLANEDALCCYVTVIFLGWYNAVYTYLCGCVQKEFTGCVVYYIVSYEVQVYDFFYVAAAL